MFRPRDPGQDPYMRFQHYMQRSLDIQIKPGYERYTFAYFKNGHGRIFAVHEIIRYSGGKKMPYTKLCEVYAALYGHPLDDKTLMQMLNDHCNRNAFQLFKTCKMLFNVTNERFADFDIALVDPTSDWVPARERTAQINTILASLKLFKPTVSEKRDVVSFTIRHLIEFTEHKIMQYNIPSDCGENFHIKQIVDEETEEQALKRCGMKSFN